MTKEEFLHSRDFMKIGQAINHESWQAAGMAAKRLQHDARFANLNEFEMNFINLKLSIAEKNGKAAKDILANIVAKRCKMLGEITNKQNAESNPNTENPNAATPDVPAKDTYIVSAFCKDGAGGNKAGVVLFREDLSNDEKMQIARDFGFSETAFVSRSDKADYKLEYYTPTDEVPLCGHATIATFSQMHRLGLIKQHALSIETKAGIFEITVEKEGLVMMEQARPVFDGAPAESAPAEATLAESAPAEATSGEAELSKAELTETELASCVGAGKIDGTYPIAVGSTGLRDIMLPIKDLASLNTLECNPNAITELCKQKDVVGIHAFTLAHDLAGVDAVCRNFAPLYGIDEESATGTSSCVLAAYLFKQGIRKNTYVFEQGYSLGLPSRLIVKLEADGDTITKVRVGGYGALAK